MISLKRVNAALSTEQGVLPVLDNINLQVPDGGICAFIGPSGCGKSTLMKIVAGILQNYRGQVLFRGERIDPKKHTIGFIPQNYGLLPWRRVKENISLGWRVKKKGTPIEQSNWRKLLSRLGIESLLERYPGEISGGQQQRVGLARAFLMQPDILLMDEPFSALDPLVRTVLQEQIAMIHQKFGTTIVFVTHDMQEAAKLACRIGVMHNGKLVQIGTPKEIKKQPANDYVQSLFSTADAPDAQRIIHQFLRLDKQGQEAVRRAVL